MSLAELDIPVAFPPLSWQRLIGMLLSLSNN